MFCITKETQVTIKSHPTEWKKLCAYNTSDKINADVHNL